MALQISAIVPKETYEMLIFFTSQEKEAENIPIKIDELDQRMKSIKKQKDRMGNKIRKKSIS